jgi:hypothetical protein
MKRKRDQLKKKVKTEEYLKVEGTHILSIVNFQILEMLKIKKIIVRMKKKNLVEMISKLKEASLGQDQSLKTTDLQEEEIIIEISIKVMIEIEVEVEEEKAMAIKDMEETVIRDVDQEVVPKIEEEEKEIEIGMITEEANMIDITEMIELRKVEGSLK